MLVYLAVKHTHTTIIIGIKQKNVFIYGSYRVFIVLFFSIKNDHTYTINETKNIFIKLQ